MSQLLGVTSLVTVLTSLLFVFETAGILLLSPTLKLYGGRLVRTLSYEGWILN